MGFEHVAVCDSSVHHFLDIFVQIKVWDCEIV